MTTQTPEAPIIDAEIVEEAAPANHSTAVVRRERRSEVIRPLNADSLVESFEQYQQLLPRLLTDDDWQGTAGAKGSFVKKSGWRKIATAFDLDVQLIRSEVERDEHGAPVRAEVWARAIAPSGRSMDGDGYCSRDESRFARAEGRQKLENDLRATATTRAMNRAISGLVGMGAVSAEEADGGPHPTAPEEASVELKQLVRNVCMYLADGDPTATGEAIDLLAKQWNGHMPAIAGQAIVLVGRAVKHHRDRENADVPFDAHPPLDLEEPA
jgi:hypothetical protein